MLQLFDFLLLPLGILMLTITGLKKSVKFTLFWLLLSPLPAVLTRDQVQAVRAYNMVIPLTLISSVGLYGLLNSVKNVRISILRTTYYILLFSVFSISLIYFLDAYFVHQPSYNAKYWQYGYKQVVEVISPLQKNYENIIFQQSYDQPYIYFLFYQKYDPVKYQKQAQLSENNIDVGLVTNLDNISFENFGWPYATGQKDTLLVGNAIAIPPDFNEDSYQLLSEIKYPDNFMTAFRIVETK
jgi:hypothetical protein